MLTVDFLFNRNFNTFQGPPGPPGPAGEPGIDGTK
ncbi:hypothetical protein AVEN_153290-1, partial [Araneus ventricosus]